MREESVVGEGNMPLPERRLQALLWMLFLAAVGLAIAGQGELSILALAGVLLLAISGKTEERSASKAQEFVWTGD